MTDPSKAPRRARFRERGQTLAIVAVMLVGLVGMLALVVDMGNIYTQRRQMQNAADAGALAGARALALSQGAAAAEAAVADLTGRNGATTYSSTIAARDVTVTARRSFPTYFASAIGIPTFTVQAVAQAGYRSPRSLRDDLVPLAVHEQTVWQGLQIVDDATVSTDLTLGRIANGDRGWLNLDGGPGGEAELARWILNGYDGPALDLPEWIYGSSGSKNAAMHAIDDNLRAGRDTIILPVYDDSQPSSDPGPGNYSFHIIGYAAFQVSQVVDRGNPKYLEGHFVEWVSRDGDGDSGEDFPVRTVYLMR